MANLLYLHLVDVYGSCHYIFYTWILCAIYLYRGFLAITVGKKIRKAPKEDNNQKLHKLRWLGFYHVLCASHRLSSVGKFRGLKQARELSTNHWEVWKASKKNARRKPRPFSNLTPKSIQSANLEFHQPGQPTPPKRTPNIGFNRVSYNQ